MRSRLRVDTKAPLAIAALISVPLFFAALMASSLALDKPRTEGLHQFPSTGSTEAKVWLAALIAPGIVIGVGVAGLLLRRWGIYLVAAAGIVVCAVLPGISKDWIPRHIARFPIGIDFIPDKDPSNLSSRGEWEHAAHATIESITRWTMGLSIGVIVVGLLVEIRRRRGRDAIAVELPPATITGEAEATPIVGDNGAASQPRP